MSSSYYLLCYSVVVVMMLSLLVVAVMLVILVLIVMMVVVIGATYIEDQLDTSLPARELLPVDIVSALRHGPEQLPGDFMVRLGRTQFCNSLFDHMKGDDFLSAHIFHEIINRAQSEEVLDDIFGGLDRGFKGEGGASGYESEELH